jgi:gliding motility-associated-like protein
MKQFPGSARMKTFLTLLILLCIFSTAKSDHITGGEMSYILTGVSAGQFTYSIRLKLLMRCNSGRQFADPTTISVFDRLTNNRIINISVPLSNQEHLLLNNTNPCISNPPEVCYDVGYYYTSVTLPATANGYLIVSQVNFRIATINNLQFNYGFIGATYTAEIPGTSPVASGPQNNSALFTGDDLVIVCANNHFSYSFAATDADGDQLHYYFCDALQSGTTGQNVTPPNPPYAPVPYNFPLYSGSAPLGANVNIDPDNGLISGIAPAAGTYVVTVCVEEIRNGMVIATQRRDIQIKIADCSIAQAVLEPFYQLCDTTQTITLFNLSNSPLINTYYWEISNAAGNIIYTSASPVITYTFADTGKYQVKLVINRGEQCSDSTVSPARVYPGFVPGFYFSGICISKPTRFFDTSTTVYGVVDSWKWDFGEISATNDTSRQKNPVYSYPTAGTKNVQFIVTNSKGCRDTVYKTVPVVDKPPITFAFRDTLICINDHLPLQATGSGNFSWTPNINIINANTPNPTVFPVVTTYYVASLDDNGCKNKDSVRVRVVDHVSLLAMTDTTICSGDSIKLRVISDGLQYVWTPASQLISSTVANPVAVTYNTTTYQVTATIGGCNNTDRVKVITIPYPLAFAGNDTTICYLSSIKLHASISGSRFFWLPSSSLSNPNILNPAATPADTSKYILFVYDDEGCPKPGIDTIVVNVLPDIIPFAGRDTAVVIGQPLQLNAGGGIDYLWSPPTGLSSIHIADPVATYNFPSNGIQYRVVVYNEAGCKDSAYITVRVFKTKPSVFVPTAFTPNGDYINDILKPITAGIERIEYFNVYDRNGKKVFSTGNTGRGWDGTIGGEPQDAGTYVWEVRAIDYRGAPYYQKGWVVLIH